jgi:hypothetical protein
LRTRSVYLLDTDRLFRALPDCLLYLGPQLLWRVLVEHIQVVVVTHLEHLGRGLHAQGVALTQVEVDHHSHRYLRELV